MKKPTTRMKLDRGMIGGSPPGRLLGIPGIVEVATSMAE